ncbi:long-chain fatty acid--CoA ligase [Calothrix sp. FACHB-1219]|uniref:ANL family adenylate-forming protein n=1 Tax=unclassified Calothrix TaxID=2619626 RepID=UPI001685D3B1|nr:MULTISPECIES: fatty acid--CoA ligase family protein [unclassified Calothrix]MBD2202773.1 long-chain fatty acid--CoA ligase [Calothrix sp. FACHB-168]MBD2218926.1 long-chain fatty acid--CoA ligase [Calothrix sp. FACHB-1219]
MAIEFLLERFDQSKDAEALIWRDRSLLYGELRELVKFWQESLEEQMIPKGAVVALEADFSPNAVALLLSLLQRNCVVALLTAEMKTSRAELRQIAEVEWIVKIDAEDDVKIEQTGTQATHQLLCQLRDRQHPGLIIFSSGSTGKSKAAIHDFVLIQEKFQTLRPAQRTLLFLLFDHIGGINTLLHVLANGGCAVIPLDRSPETVAAAIAKHRVQLLPTSPTFLTLLLLSGVHQQYDLSSLEIVTYGTEVMPQSVLNSLNQLFPHIRFHQTYGLTELGIMRSKSRSSDSLWFKVGGEGYETRIVNGMLEIKAKSAMLGYLNAPAPFTLDGWYMTGDVVEVDGEWLRILGRKSELINVGGQKVYPAEVESVVQGMEGVLEVSVKGEANSITGNIVTAKIRLTTDESLRDFRTRLRAFCQDKLESYKIPVRVTLVEERLHSDRFKKNR